MDPKKLGILLLDSEGDHLLGDPAHPETFRDSIRVKAKGVTFKDLLQPHETVLHSLQAAISELEFSGAEMIIGTCGLLSLYERTLFFHSEQPMILSSLKALTVISQSYKPEQIGIVTAHSGVLSPLHVNGYGYPLERMHRIGLQEGNHFKKTIIDKSEKSDLELLAKETAEILQPYLSGHPQVKILVSECTNLLPLRDKWKESVAVPIVDLYSLLSICS